MPTMALLSRNNYNVECVHTTLRGFGGGDRSYRFLEPTCLSGCATAITVYPEELGARLEMKVVETPESQEWMALSDGSDTSIMSTFTGLSQSALIN